MRAIELIRVSTEAQAGEDRASIPAQRTVNHLTAARFGLEIVETIELTDVSGANVLLAPEIQRLITLMQSPTIDGVVTREFSRLMRPEKFSDYALLQAFADSRTKLYLPDGPIDFSEKSGRLMGTIRAAIAGLERSEIQDRCWRGKEEKRKAGKNVCPRLPFGVGYDKERGFFYNSEAPRARKAFDMLLSGVTSYAAIAERTGLAPGGLFKLLHNPIWTGWRVYEWKCDPRSKCAKADGRQGYSRTMRRNLEDVIRVKVIDSPLLTEDEFAAARRIMDSKREAHRRERPSPALYSGFLFCKFCGSHLTPYSKNRNGFRYYVCRKRLSVGADGRRCEQGYIAGEKIEDIVDQFLRAQFSTREFALELSTRTEETRNVATLQARIERLETELRSLDAKRSRIMDAFLEGDLSKSARDERIRTLDARTVSISDELAFVRGLIAPGAGISSLADLLEPFLAINVLPRTDRRRLLGMVFRKIFIEGYSISGSERLFV